MTDGQTLNYFAVPWVVIPNPLPLFLVAIINTGLIGAVEFYRRNGTGPAGYSPGIGKFESKGACWCGVMWGSSPSAPAACGLLQPACLHG
jgi:hypothetical protein